MRDRWIRPLAIVIGSVFVTSVLSVGQVQFERDQKHRLSQADGDPGFDTLPGASGGPVTPGATGPADAPTGAPKPGSTARPGSGGRPGAPGSVPTGSIPTTRPSGGGKIGVPDFGLKTQGVTATSVKLGLDYNKSGCGDAGALEAALGPAVVGDPEKAVKAFTNHVNDTGGVRGRRLSVVTVDDGGLQCPERNEAAAIEMVDQQKVFLAMVGLHDVGDAVIKRDVPIWGGRSTKAEQRARGFGQFQLFQDADSDFANWASFGRNYLGTNGTSKRACFVHPDTADFNNLEKIMVAKMAAQGLKFEMFIRYADDASTGQQQATAATIKMKGKCEQVWFIANNFIAMVFFTNAAQQQDFHPLYTFTGRTALIDQQLGGALLQQDQWANAVGLSPRIKPGDHPKEGNCKKIYEKYYPADGLSGSASVTLACVSILTTTEAMKRAVDLTGQLTANSLMVGINAIQRDFYWEAHVPMTYTIPTSLSQPFDFTGYDHQTVVKWSRQAQDYTFPEYPRYWRTFGPGGSGGEDLRAYYDDTWKGATR
ncbi:MAG: branched-chain amino acid transport system substrate-binding protein [Frankiaceae bacterium]|nr:branched-chain amino acid transport system substrate-binding protein [Frankiaceae bacterium]